MIYTGILAITTFIISIIAWLCVLFYPQITSIIKNKAIYTHTALLLMPVLFSFFMRCYCDSESRLPGLLHIVIIALLVIEIILLCIRRVHSALPLVTGIFAFLFSFPTSHFCKIAYCMWNKEVDVGSVRYSEISALQRIHILLVLMLMVLIIILLIRLFKRVSFTNWFSVIGSIAYLICSNISLLSTIPNCDESISWIILLPCLFVFDFILVLTILLCVFVTIIRQIKKHNLRNMLFMLIHKITCSDRY